MFTTPRDDKSMVSLSLTLLVFDSPLRDGAGAENLSRPLLNQEVGNRSTTTEKKKKKKKRATRFSRLFT